LAPEEDALFWEPNFTAAAFEDEKGYMAMLSGFLDVLEGKKSRIADAEAGLAAMNLLEACWTSWREKREVYLDPSD
jgi:myo-inositol 2-dehydrogenase/D-chiro-inositol 1-dehydrogenase